MPTSSSRAGGNEISRLTSTKIGLAQPEVKKNGSPPAARIDRTALNDEPSSPRRMIFCVSLMIESPPCGWPPPTGQPPRTLGAELEIRDSP